MNINEIFDLLHKIIDVENTLKNPHKILDTNKYYYWTNYFYRKFHSKKGAMHFPLYLENGAKNHFEGLETQVNFVKNCINENTNFVAEIGYGQGFNTHLLASQYPNVQFSGIDLVPRHQTQASKTAQKLGLQNTNFLVQDFEKSYLFPQKQDIFFAIESFCYAQNLQNVFENVRNNLRKNGKFIIFDMFSYNHFDTLPLLVQQASQLSAIGYAVNHWKKLDFLLENAKNAGFSVVDVQDFTYSVRPNAIRFQKDAVNFLKNYTYFIKYLSKFHILPDSILFHIIAGAIAPYAWEAQGYFLIIMSYEL